MFSPIMSGVQRLPSGNTLICLAIPGELFEVTPEGKIVWKYAGPLPQDPWDPREDANPQESPGGDVAQPMQISYSAKA